MSDEKRTGLRILLIAPEPFFQERGTPIAIRSTATSLVSAGHRIHILTYHEGEPWSVEGCTVERIPRLPGIRGIRPGFSFKKLVCDVVLFAACWRRVGAEPFDVLHGVEEGGFIAWIIGRVRGLPHVYDMDSSIPQQLVERWRWMRAFTSPMNSLEGRTIRSSVGVLTVCRALEDHARELGPRTLIGRVEDRSLLEGDQDHAPVEDVPADWKDVVLYVGNLEPYQGVDLLLRAFALAAERRAELRLVVVGGAPEDVAAGRRKAEELGCADRVRFLGPRPTNRLGAYLHRATIVVSPRLRGVNTPMKVYSYMDAGVAIVATDLSTHTQVLDDRTALLVEPRPAAMSEALVTLARDPDLRARLGQAARRRYRAEFGSEAYDRKLRAFYNAVGARVRGDADR